MTIRLPLSEAEYAGFSAAPLHLKYGAKFPEWKLENQTEAFHRGWAVWHDIYKPGNENNPWYRLLHWLAARREGKAFSLAYFSSHGRSKAGPLWERQVKLMHDRVVAARRIGQDI